MLSKEEILNFNNHYDFHSYPPQVYEDLVVNQIEYQNRFEILGAWKGGCLRKDPTGIDFVDSNSERYSFTKRWNYKAPVSRLAWETISEIEFDIANQIPKEFPQDEPRVMQLLKDRKGFGFVLSTFLMHCYHPDIYPIYDQHVYRAYQNLINHEQKRIRVASTKWQDYLDFQEFTNKIKQETRLPYWIIDRSLWHYGKTLSNKKNDNNRRRKSKTSKIIQDTSLWNELNTLGGRAKHFNWRITPDNSIEIRRINSIEIEKIEEKVVNSLNSFFVDKDWFALANSVSKVHDGTEKVGVGWYLYNYHGFSETKQQLASHLSAIFVNSGIWDYNQKKRDIRFKILDLEWQSILKDYYQKEKTLYNTMQTP